jgi:hemolysin III
MPSTKSTITDIDENSNPPYSPIEERANTFSHALGLVLGVIASIVLIVEAYALDDNWKVASFYIYGASLLSLYLASTLYHGMRNPVAKKWLKVFDHCAIYLLIAGTYTPFLLVLMRDGTGLPMMAAIWGIAAAGITLKLAFPLRFHLLRVASYVLMGWLVMLSGAELMQVLPSDGMTLLAVGGIVYTVGVAFYLGHSIPFNHAIWHLFVLGGSVFHFLSIYLYVLPATSA